MKKLNLKRKSLSLALALLLCASLAAPAFAGGSAKRSEAATVGENFTIATASDKGYAIKNDGTLWGWGSNGRRLGDGTEEDRPQPVKIMDGVISVRTTGRQTLALKADGTLWGWGSYWTERGGYDTKIAPVQMMTDVAAVCAEIDYSTFYAIKKDGTLWEGDLYNVLGGNEAPAKLLDGVKSVRFADDFTSTIRQAVKTDGTLWQWGVTYQYDEGIKDFVVIAENKTPVRVTEGAAEIIAGFKEGPAGQFVSELTSEKIAGWEKELGKLAGIADSGYNDFLVLAEDGKLWAYGRNGGNPNAGRDASQLVLTDVRLPGSAPVAVLVARPTASTVLIDGVSVAFDAYNINDNNYFKLRDLAYALDGSSKSFEVTWDAATNAIALTSGQAYSPVGGEMSAKGAVSKTPVPTASKIYLDGKEISFTAYNIDGNNYFKLRDIGAAFDFGVDWDGASNTITLDTSKSYEV